MESSPNPSSRITIRDIAKKAGVHFTTVSMALHDNPRLRAETREKVQKVAREMGYQPDPMLSALNAYRLAKGTPQYKATIAWINNWPVQKDLRANIAFNEYYQGAWLRAQELGYKIEEFWLREEGMTPEKLNRILKARGIQGLLMPPQPFSNTPPPIDFSDYSAVAFGYTMKPSVLHLVTNYHFHSINLTLEHLYALGYRRIGFFGDSGWDEKVGNAWIAGLLFNKRKHPDLVVISPVLNKRFQFRRNELITTHGLDAVISYTKDLFALRELGYEIPGKLGFASLDVSVNDEEVSGIYENDLLIGIKAFDVLVGMLHRNERGLPKVSISTLVEGEWRPGKTLRQL